MLIFNELQGYIKTIRIATDFQQVTVIDTTKETKETKGTKGMTRTPRHCEEGNARRSNLTKSRDSHGRIRSLGMTMVIKGLTQTKGQKG